MTLCGWVIGADRLGEAFAQPVLLSEHCWLGCLIKCILPQAWRYYTNGPNILSGLMLACMLSLKSYMCILHCGTEPWTGEWISHNQVVSCTDFVNRAFRCHEQGISVPVFNSF